MSKTTIALLLVFALCIFSCRKDKGVPKPTNNNNNDTDSVQTAAVDFREKYVGIFEISVHYIYSTHPSGGESHTFDTTYYYKVNIGYKITDSIELDPYRSGHIVKRPTISFFDYNGHDSLFRKEIIDSAGHFYGGDTDSGGGFVNADSLNCKFSDVHISYTNSHILNGHRVQ